MIVVRDEQLRKLSVLVREPLLADIEAAVRNEQPTSVATLNDAELRSRVTFAVDRAEVNGLSLRSSVMFFALLLFAFGPDFDQRSAVREQLESDFADEAIFRLLDDAPLTLWVLPEPDTLETSWQRAMRGRSGRRV